MPRPYCDHHIHGPSCPDCRHLYPPSDAPLHGSILEPSEPPFYEDAPDINRISTEILAAMRTAKKQSNALAALRHAELVFSVRGMNGGPTIVDASDPWVRSTTLHTSPKIGTKDSAELSVTGAISLRASPQIGTKDSSKEQPPAHPKARSQPFGIED